MAIMQLRPVSRALSLTFAVGLICASQSAAATTNLYSNLYIAAGSSGSNAVGDTLAPLIPNATSSDFRVDGTFVNEGKVVSGGFFDNSGFVVGASGLFNNSGTGELEELHGANAGTIQNFGIWRINFFDGGSSIQLGPPPSTHTEFNGDLFAGIDNTSTGRIRNFGTILNFGILKNQGIIDNKPNSTFVSAWNSNIVNIPILSQIGPYQVRIENLVNSPLTNEGAFDNGTFADFQQHIQTSTFVNSGVFVNDGVNSPLNPASAKLRNFDTLINHGGITNQNGAVIENNGILINADDQGGTGVIDNKAHFINNGGFGGENNGQGSVGAFNNNGTFTNNGLFFNSSKFHNQGSLVNLGEISLAGDVTNDGELINDHIVIPPPPPVIPPVFPPPQIQIISGFISTLKFTNTTKGHVINRGGFSNSNEFDNAGQVTIAQTGSFGGDGLYKQTAGKTEVQGFMSRAKIRLEGGDFVVAPGAFVQTAPTSDPFVQTGGKLRNDGLIVASEVSLEGGVFSGGGKFTGSLSNPAVLTNVVQTGGMMAPGDPVTLTINGNYHMLGGVLDIQIASVNDFDRVVVTGLAEFTGGTIQLDFINGFAPHAGDIFNFLVSDHVSFDSSLMSFVINGLEPNFEFNVDFDFNGHGLVLNALTDGVTAAPVPLPAALWLFMPALGAIYAGARRNSAARFKFFTMRRLMRIGNTTALFGGVDRCSC